MGDDYAHAITKQAVARAAVALGFKQSNNAVLDSLADVVRHYVESLGENAGEVSEIGGRVQPGIQDFMTILGDPNKPDHWKKLRDFAFENTKGVSAGVSLGVANGGTTTRWNQPFPFPVPEFPVRQRSKARTAELPVSSSSSSSAATRAATIPGHLPQFPPAHTYKKSIPNVNPRAIVSTMHTAAAGNSNGNRKRPAPPTATTSKPTIPSTAVSSSENVNIDDPAQRKKRMATIKSVRQSLVKIEEGSDRAY